MNQMPNRYIARGLKTPESEREIIIHVIAALLRNKGRGLAGTCISATLGTFRYYLPRFYIGIPATIILTALHVEGNIDQLAGLELAHVDLIAPYGDTYFLGVVIAGFENELLFFPGAVLSLSAL